MAWTVAQAQRPAGQPEPPAVSAKELLQKLDQMKAGLKDKPKSAEIEFALGNLYYENGRWPEAIDSYRQLLERADPPLQRYLALRSKPHRQLSPREADCGGGERPTFDALIAAADRKAKIGNPSAALVCAEAALLPLTVALTRQGNAWYLIGNDERAIAAHQRALTLSPDNPDSLFFLGAILFEGGEGDMPRLMRAKGFWQRFLQVSQDPQRVPLVTKDLVRLQLAIDNRGHIPPERLAQSKPPGPGSDPQPRHSPSTHRRPAQRARRDRWPRPGAARR